MKKSIILLGMAFVLAILFTSCGGVKPEKTIQNLKDAITGETAASAKYAAFSKKAQEEGLTNIAKLFAATSKAEEIHINNHKKVLEKLGVTDFVPEMAEPIVGTTAENLQAGIDGETYEVTTMYPGFIETANVETVNDAATSFGWAMEAEKKHAKLYADALIALQAAASVVTEEGQTPVAADSTVSAKWLVCPKCGDAYSGDSGVAACNICGTAIENFIVIE